MKRAEPVVTAQRDGSTFFCLREPLIAWLTADVGHEKMKHAVLTLLMVIATSACDETPIPVDAALAKNAPVVLRAKLIAGGSADKYAYFEIEVLRVFKNESGVRVKEEVEVRSYSWRPGVPKGESTLYLERYNPSEEHIWSLVGGEASTGVSHNSK